MLNCPSSSGISIWTPFYMCRRTSPALSRAGRLLWRWEGCFSCACRQWRSWCHQLRWSSSRLRQLHDRSEVQACFCNVGLCLVGLGLVPRLDGPRCRLRRLHAHHQVQRWFHQLRKRILGPDGSWPQWHQLAFCRNSKSRLFLAPIYYHNLF